MDGNLQVGTGRAKSEPTDFASLIQLTAHYFCLRSAQQTIFLPRLQFRLPGSSLENCTPIILDRLPLCNPVEISFSINN
jgi:hypothetical protein